MTEYEAGRAAVPIGREEEMDRILRCLDVRSGPQGLIVLGETGSGRSRMLRFAEETAAARGHGRASVNDLVVGFGNPSGVDAEGAPVPGGGVDAPA